MRDLKYIIVFFKYPAMARAIIFNGEINHCDVVPKGWTVVSAGFCTISGEKFGDLTAFCFGKSTSLNIESQPTVDKLIVEQTLNRSFLY